MVLAAGGSHRLGCAKQLLIRDGESWVRRTARLALASQADRVLVIGGARADEIGAAVADLPVEWLLNSEWQEGMASSLRVAASALTLHAGPVLILGCDQPALETTHLHALLALAHGTPSGCAATAHGERIGIPAVVSPSILRTAYSLRGDRGLRDVLYALPRDGMAVLDAPELRFDVDTPADLDIAHARGWLDV